MQKLDDALVRQIEHEEEIDLRQYWNVLRRRKWVILGLAVAVTTIAALVVFAIKPVYRATTTVMIESKEANVVSIQDVYGLDTRGQEYYQTQFEILKSRPLAEKVVTRLQLATTPEFAKDPAAKPFWSSWLSLPEKEEMFGPRDEQALVVNHYKDLLQVSPVPKTQLVKVSFESHDPEQASAIANAHAQAFIESHLEAKESMSRSASEWMSGRLDELRLKLTAAEGRLQAFKEREHLVDVEGIQGLPARELNELTTKLVDARRDLSQANNAYTQVNQVRGASLDDKLTIPAIKSDALVQQFRQAHAEADLKVAELSKRYGAQHPKMKAAVSERDAAERALAHQVDSVMEAIRNEHDVARGQAQAIAAAMDTAKSDVQLVGRKDSEYRALLREVETSRQLYDLFYTRISETNESGDLASANARVIEPASVPLQPVKPQKKMVIVLTFVLTLMLAVMLAFLLEMLDNTVKHATDVEQKLGVQLLGLLPLLRKKRKAHESIGLEFTHIDTPAFGEAIRTVRTGVTLSSLDKAQKLIMVTSSVSGEGKTSVSCNLALAFAQVERVLLIDADMRRPSVAKEFGLDRSQSGLSDLCAGTVNATECIVRNNEYKLDILTAGMVPPNPQELLGSRRLQSVLANLKENYDRVIIDCPPVLPVSDALLLANLVDMLVYVVKADATSVTQIKSGIQQIKRTPVSIAGVVLNQVDTVKLSAYGEYGGGYYYGGYAADKAA